MRADRAFGQKATREWDAPWFSNFATCHMFYSGNPERLRSKAREVYDVLHGLDRRLRDGKQQV